MCGITGYAGLREALPVLVNSLKRLEYRGYDSCGVALENGDIQVYKDIGTIEDLQKNVLSGIKNGAHLGLGHTRWATHGKPSKNNAHPHVDCRGDIAVVHNGVINNYFELKQELIAEGHTFRSETDTEVIPHLIEKYFIGDLQDALRKTLGRLQGSYAVIALHRKSDYMAVARNESPLILAIGDRENLVASDVPAVLDYADRVIYLEDNDLALVGKDRVEVTSAGSKIERTVHHINWSIADAEKSGYRHFMLKEIHEQPRVIRDTSLRYLWPDATGVDLDPVDISRFKSVLFLASGSSYHAAMVGRHALEEIAKVPAHVELASEFGYAAPISSNALAIGISQSGETADTLKSLKHARRLGYRTLAVTNVVGSSITRAVDQVFYMQAGPEISVAATKSFVAQLVAVYLLALSASRMDVEANKRLISELRFLPNAAQQILDAEEEIARIAREIAGFDNVFYIGRGVNLPVALEGALKLKEISYIHAEGFAAGEIKHGPFALLTDRTPVIALITADNAYDALLSNIKEIKARESPVVAVAHEGDDQVEKLVDRVIRVPRVPPMLSPVLNTIVLQLLAYYAADQRGCCIDRPRNLAKSVTVE